MTDVTGFSLSFQVMSVTGCQRWTAFSSCPYFGESGVKIDQDETNWWHHRWFVHLLYAVYGFHFNHSFTDDGAACQ